MSVNNLHVLRSASILNFVFLTGLLTLSGHGFSRVPGPGGGGEGKEPATYNSKTIHCIEMKFGRVVDYHKLINLV